MISVSEASHIILNHLFTPVEEHVSVHEALGRVLMQDIVADTDLPHAHRVMMDGVAIRSEDWNRGTRTFSVAAVQHAGVAQMNLSDANTCIEVMTGAVCPAHADAVVPYEQIEIANGVAFIKDVELRPWLNIHLQGTDKKKGDVIVMRQTLLNAAHLAAIASVGGAQVAVASLPKVHIFSTGNELVEIATTPQPHQIRRSNVYALQQLLLARGITTTQSHLADNKAAIENALAEALATNDVILLSGGVSAGQLDLLPDALQAQGVEKLFHRIAQKPGKPMWFGKKNKTIVFALPGNPVSTFFCAVRYVLPWLRASLFQQEKAMYAKLSHDFSVKTSLAYYLQVKLTVDVNGCTYAEPSSGSGSGDFANLAKADAFAEITESKLKGEVVRIFPFA